MPVSAPTLAELKTAAETEIQTIAPELNDFREGSALDAISGAGAILGDAVIRHVTSSPSLISMCSGVKWLRSAVIFTSTLVPSRVMPSSPFLGAFGSSI